MGLISDVTIDAPSEAAPGDLVTPVSVEVTNHDPSSWYLLITAKVNDSYLQMPGDPVYFLAGETKTFYDQFIMPERSVVLTAEIFREALPGEWILDATDTKAVYLAAPTVAGVISRKELEYDESRGDIPVSNVPHGQRGLVHIWGRNDTDVAQRMGVYWFVADPDGYVVEEYETWEAWPYTGSGDEHEFIGGRFDLTKEGRYAIWAELLMNPDNPQIVDRYIGELCNVAEVVPESQFRGFAVSEYTRV